MKVLSCERFYPLAGHDCPNQSLLNELAIIRKAHLLEGGKDDPRFITFAQACSTIKAYKRVIQSPAEARKLPHVDETISALIEQFLNTGKIELAEKWKNNQRFHVLRQLDRISGVGIATALRLYDVEGIRSLDEMRHYSDDRPESELRHTPRISMKYFDDTQIPMSRGDAESIRDFLQLQLDKILIGGIIVICGGYRRGQTSMTDIDLLITYPEEGAEKGILKKLLHRLAKKGLIPEDGVIYQQHIASHRSSPHNACASRLDNLDRAFLFFKHPRSSLRSRDIYRRVDIVISRIGSFACATLAWTGSIQFNRDIRKVANNPKLGYLLDAGGLELNGKEIPVASEQEIFSILGLDYIPPEYRNTDP